jgi:hypothetical protein
MIASFFRHLDQHHVDWLLVSGQATILYGAATFSEDIDLWVEPSADNLERLTAALRASAARYYKLTPALTAEAAARHHGFHFTIPEPEEGTAVYLDVMGRPPRVGSFGRARQQARTFETQWGTLCTVGIPDLVELKKTQRPRDYPIVGRLVLTFMRERRATFSEQELRWAADNVFGLTEFRQLVDEFPNVARVLGSAPVLREAAESLSRGGLLAEAVEDEIEDVFDARMARLRKADRHFWRCVVEELRQLRAQGKLMPEGELV